MFCIDPIIINQDRLLEELLIPFGLPSDGGETRAIIWKSLCRVLLEYPKPSHFFEELRRQDALEPWFSELSDLIGLEQDPEYHPEGDVWIHTMMVTDLCAEMRDEAQQPLALMLGALSHDFGKKVTTSVQKGRIHAYGHEAVGARLARNFVRRLTDDAGLVESVSNLVRLHMNPGQLVRQSAPAKAYMKLFDRAASPEDLLLLCKADNLGRRLTEEYQQQENVLRRYLRYYRELMKRPEVTREDLLKAGLPPGSEMDDVLIYTHKAHLAGVPRSLALPQGINRLKQLLKESCSESRGDGTAE